MGKEREEEGERASERGTPFGSACKFVLLPLTLFDDIP